MVRASAVGVFFIVGDDDDDDVVEGTFVGSLLELLIGYDGGELEDNQTPPDGWDLVTVGWSVG